MKWSQDSIVSVVTGLQAGWLRNHGSIPGRDKRFFSSNRTDQLWGPPNLLINEKQGLLPQSKVARGMKLTSHLQVVPRVRMCGAVLLLPFAPLWHAQEQVYLMWSRMCPCKLHCHFSECIIIFWFCWVSYLLYAAGNFFVPSFSLET